jgi:hypothetical protein
LIKRYWKATIRGYHFMRIVPENYPFQRFVEAKIRVNNPDPAENMRDLRPIRIMESSFFPLDGQLTVDGIWRILEEHQDAACWRNQSRGQTWKMSCVRSWCKKRGKRFPRPTK